MATRSADWDSIYRATEQAPWEAGRPQEALVRLAESGLLSGRVLDAGCGTGDHALLAAEHGGDVTGIDCSATAIARARRKAAERGLKVRFETGDVLDLAQLGTTFDTVVDVGMFHVLDDEERRLYVRSLTSVTEPGGTCHLMCFSDRQPGALGPRRITQAELREAFADGWEMLGIAPETFAVAPQFGRKGHAWLAAIRRTAP
ncbi:class I SAM-dependent methyltransferase [Streptomyces sp. NPDC086777]|uniref:class I SAM-dependent methyltransferase n=1 Tax=Streptomyces sp. NPDC086777 TaxID=3154866 RepID=UPI0034502015